MSKKKEKKPFFETGFGKFLKGAGKFVPDALGVAAKVATGDIKGAIDDVTGALSGNPDPEAQALLTELELKKMEFSMELARIEADDRHSARMREVEMAKAGKEDRMMNITGFAALIIFLIIILIVFFRDLEPFQEKIAIHILGIVEGMIISMFTYYFGSSRGSKDKGDQLDKILNEG